MSTRVTLGRVAGVHGIKGWVKVVSYTRPVENLLDYRRWFIAKGEGWEAKVIEGQVQGRGLMVHISDATGAPITDRDVAATLIGSEIQVDRKDLPKPKKGEFYWFDLIGQEVVNVEGVVLGRIREMTSNGAQDVMVLEDGEVERLIPYVVGPIVKSVDPKNKRIVCDWQPDF
jgi:16S rRNA processing protein RimM